MKPKTEKDDWQVADANFALLLEENDWESILLASQIAKACHFRAHYLDLIVEKITRLYLKDFLPATQYHRFGNSLLDKMTFEWIFQKINLYLRSVKMEVDVNYERLILKNHFLCPRKVQIVSTRMEGLTDSLYYSLHANFTIQAE